jgi:hypothetical protein
MEMDITKIFIGFLFLVVGIALFLGAIVVRLRLEKEIKGGRKVVLNNFLPYWNSDDFSERGNSLRKKYNNFYFALIVYSLSLLFYMKSGG